VSLITRYLASALASLGREVFPLECKEELLARVQGDPALLADALEKDRRGAEIALLEIPNELNERQARYAACAPDVILILAPGPSALQDAYLLIKRILSVSGKCRLHVLANQSTDMEYAKRIFGNLSATSNKFLSQPLQFLGELPYDERLSRGNAQDINLLDSHPHAPLAVMLRALAERILLWPYPGENDMSGFARRLVAALPAPPVY
jgi:flagellar biosynthesis protein FlhG